LYKDLYNVLVVVSGIGRPPVRCETHLGLDFGIA